MSDLKEKLRLVAFASGIAGVFAGTNAHAGELWNTELPGFEVGLPAGLLPPPGVYGQLDNYFAQFVDYTGEGKKIQGSSIDALAVAPSVLWVPGITVLGATYGMAVAMPFDYTSYTATQRETPGGWKFRDFQYPHHTVNVVMVIAASFICTRRDHVFFE